MTQYVQIAVPKELYDKLGLHLNQTITLKCSQDTCELDTRVNDDSTVSDEASNKHHKLILSKKSSNDDSVDGKANDSSAEKHDGTFQVIRVNPVGCDPQSCLTPNVTLINSQSSNNDPSEGKDASDSSDDPSDLDDISCDAPASKKAKMDDANVEKVSSKNESTKEEYPRNCELCNRRVYCHATMAIHKEHCRPGKLGGPGYMRMCPTCHRCYFTPSAYFKHKSNCVNYSRTQSFDKQKSIVKAVTPAVSNLNPSGSASSSNTADVEGSQVVNAEEKTEKWIPVSNLTNMHKYFIVKNK